MKHVEITTLTGKKVQIAEVSDYTTMDELKALYQDSEGVPADQQQLWFPCDHLEGAQPATAFEWWEESSPQLDPEVRNAMLAEKLIRDADVPADEGSNMPARTLGAVMGFREGASPQYLSGIVLPCFVVLQLRAEGPTDEQPEVNLLADVELEVDKTSAALDVELMSENDADESLHQSFAVFDVNGDGKLSLDELKDILTRVPVSGDGDEGPKLSEADVQEILDSADVDGDGKLDIDEYIALMRGRHASQLG
jgi:TPR repeat protein